MIQASDLDFVGTSRIIGLPTPLLNDEATNKGYVDNLLNGALHYRGFIDCSTNPNYPVSIVGDYYVCNADGLIGGASGLPIHNGDAFICNTANAGGDQATVGAFFNILERNEVYATTTTPGYIQLATQSEVNAGIVTDKTVTPATLATLVSNQVYAQNFGGAGLSYVITHNLGTKDIIVQVREVSTDNVVLVDIQNTSINTVTVSGFLIAPAANSLRIVVRK